MEYVQGESALAALRARSASGSRRIPLRVAVGHPVAASCTGCTPRTRRRTSAASRSASSTATSRRRTCSSAPTASRACSTSAWPRPPVACRRRGRAAQGQARVHAAGAASRRRREPADGHLRRRRACSGSAHRAAALHGRQRRRDRRPRSRRSRRAAEPRAPRRGQVDLHRLGDALARRARRDRPPSAPHATGAALLDRARDGARDRADVPAVDRVGGLRLARARRAGRPQLARRDGRRDRSRAGRIITSRAPRATSRPCSTRRTRLDRGVDRAPLKDSPVPKRRPTRAREATRCSRASPRRAR